LIAPVDVSGLNIKLKTVPVSFSEFEYTTSSLLNTYKPFSPILNPVITPVEFPHTD